jgi:hypothetical protein
VVPRPKISQATCTLIWNQTASISLALYTSSTPSSTEGPEGVRIGALPRYIVSSRCVPPFSTIISTTIRSKAANMSSGSFEEARET